MVTRDIAKALAEITAEQLLKRDRRIAELEQRIVDLEKATGTAKVVEWPLRTGTKA